MLDQVEDAISVEDATICDNSASVLKFQDGEADDLLVKVDPAVERTKSHRPEEVINESSNSHFLVLEVCFVNLY